MARFQLDADFWILDVEYSDHSSIQLFIEYPVSSNQYRVSSYITLPGWIKAGPYGPGTLLRGGLVGIAEKAAPDHIGKHDRQSMLVDGTLPAL